MTATPSLIPPAEVVFDPDEHRYIVDGIERPGVTTILGSLNNFDAIPMDVLHNAALRGTEVHRLCELFDTDQTDSCDARLIPYVRAWLQFRTDTGFRPDAIEERVHHPVYDYCGTLDRVGYLDGHRAVIDIKTSWQLSPVTGLQLAAYQAAWETMHPDQPATHRYAVQLVKDGSYHVREYADYDDFATFLSALHLFNWKERVATASGRRTRKER